MGGAGTWHLAAKHPDLWAGLGVVAAAPPQDVEATTLLTGIRHVPTIVIQGSDDDLVPVTLTRQWVDAMAGLGMQHVYVEVAGGDHSLLISQDQENMRKIVDFFSIVCRCDRAPQ
jgi:pimeloyl-ACP methyl ester carboxylesterase